MSLLVAIPNRNIDKLLTQLKRHLGEDLVQQWPDVTDPDSVTMVLGWQVPADLWQSVPNVQAVASFGAGVDGLNLAAVPQHLPVTRVVDPNLATDMAEYVLSQILLHKTNMPRYTRQQQQSLWQPKRVQPHNRVGLLGFGQLGQAIAKRLHANGFEIMAWSNSQKQDADAVHHFYGESGLHEMVARTDYLVCVLPLTQQTTQIIDAQLLALLPSHAVVINVGRGQHLDEQALIEAIKEQRIGGASLDVFTHEPLPTEHEFWHNPHIIVTPHCSALTSVDTVVNQVVDNYNRLQQGSPLEHCIDRDKNY
ncbi:2-hydroxyacid dehydrogenase [Pseudoalteromonas sp. SSDWG2]|uniref:2-hydroxyacid dehydrogenase n=1 Tax=Pseudoalteromonas sp. SSDWG2 TaxID=3139391 RepID=UPI003BAB5CBB